MKPLPPWFTEKLDQLLTETYLKGREDGITEGRKMEREEQLEDNKRINI